jgi:hypothetical protein
MVATPPPARRSAAARLVAAHAALALAVGLAAALLYSAVLATPTRPAWAAIDLALLGGLVAAVIRWGDSLGLAALGPRRLPKLAALAAIALAMVLVSHLLVADRNGVWLDESQYLETLRRGELVRDGLRPFNQRWLVPFLAGRWNLLPVEDAEALKALSFAGFAVTGFYLALLLVRLRVPLAMAATAPLFLMSSYLGTYGASNRLVIDSFNYAMFSLLFHALVRREHAPLFGALLLLASFNSEKAIGWLPVFAAVELLRQPRSTPPAWAAALRHAALATLRVAWPTLLYLAALALYLAPSRTELTPCPENLSLIAFSWQHPLIRGTCAEGTTFHMVWFPFGPFTVYALLGFVTCARWLKAIPLLLGPVLLQVVLATDTERMAAYAFIVLLPLGFLYLWRALRSMPRWLGRALFSASAALAALQHYLVPLVRGLELSFPVRSTRLAMSALELALVGAILLLHHAVFGDGGGDGAGDGDDGPQARS